MNQLSSPTWPVSASGIMMKGSVGAGKGSAKPSCSILTVSPAPPNRAEADHSLMDETSSEGSPA